MHSVVTRATGSTATGKEEVDIAWRRGTVAVGGGYGIEGLKVPGHLLATGGFLSCSGLAWSYILTAFTFPYRTVGQDIRY